MLTFLANFGLLVGVVFFHIVHLYRFCYYFCALELPRIVSKASPVKAKSLIIHQCRSVFLASIADHIGPISWLICGLSRSKAHQCSRYIQPRIYYEQT